jgi:signal transduction histidine kinase
MGRLVESLLLLARCDADHLPLAALPLDLAALVREVWARHANAAAERGVVVELTTGPAVVAADPTLVDVVLSNLLSNAASYTPRGGVVRLTTNAANGEATVRVENTVDGLRREDVSSLFERFWRKDAARTESLHAGIGLAVAREITRRLGGRLEAEMAGDSTLMLTFTLPSEGSPTGGEDERNMTRVGGPLPDATG